MAPSGEPVNQPGLHAVMDSASDVAGRGTLGWAYERFRAGQMIKGYELQRFPSG
jgi:hypothetical protein